jgi:acylphosphatase
MNAPMNDVPEQIARHVRIKGKVQRVFFRNWIVEEATKRGLRGWVRNRSDNIVEAVFAGEVSAVRAMAKACYKGPPKAEVTDVIQYPGEFRPTDDDFGEAFKKLPSIA